MLFRCVILIALAFGSPGSAGAQSDLPPLFDPDRHMRVDEVRPGMKGFGLSVFSGTKIERFDVEVVSVLYNFNPRHHVVLIQCTDERMRRSGPVAGMSGSPVFLKDDQGRERMIGAFAYGWPMMRDVPLAGVQPIEYMLALPAAKDSPKAPANGGAASALDPTTHQPQKPSGKVHWWLQDAIPIPGVENSGSASPILKWGTLQPHPRLMSGDAGDTDRLRPLVTPLMTSGLPTRLVEDFAPLFRAYGLALLQSGGGAGVGAGGGTGKYSALRGDYKDTDAAKIEPGSVMAAPLLTGDVDLTAVGTCTEVVGDRVVGFGHSFNNEGLIELPFASGEIQAVVSKLDQSFKLGSASKLRGTLTNDRVTGVGGTLGAAPPSVPIDIDVVYTDGSGDLKYHFDSAIHPRLTPMLATMAMSAALTSARELPQYHTVDYAMKLEFANGKTVDVSNVAVNVQPVMLFMELGLPLSAASENPFGSIAVKKITGSVKVTPEARNATILSINVPKLKFRPGETVKAFVTYRPFRAPEAVLPVELELPRDLPNGPYQLVVGDWQRYLMDEVMSRPFRFSAENADEVFDVIKDFTSIRHDALYVRLVRQADGVAIGRTAMPQLPSSRRQVMLGAGRSNTTAFVSSSVKTIPTKLVIDGSAEFEITIDSKARVEVGGAKGVTKTEPSTPPQTTPNASEEKDKDKKPQPPAKTEKDSSSNDTQAEPK